MRRCLLPAIVLVLALALVSAPASADTTVANGMRLVDLGAYGAPVHVTGPPGDPRRVFVVEKGSGTTAHIMVVRDGVKLAQPFLTLTGVATSGPSGEQGLLSMAFAPDYATSGRFYVYFIDASACSPDGCDVRVDEYVRATEDTAGAFQRTLFTVDHRVADNHNGAQIAFGPDGLLYAGPGDGGGAGDAPCNAQNPGSRLGKILRVDTRQPGALTPQVYALGVRNPFRFSFDRLTGDLVIGDVGQGDFEEVDFLAAGTPPGANLGWSWFEGNSPFASTTCAGTPPPGLVAPIITYPNPEPGGSAVTGGVVVRDTSMTPVRGRYLYADFYAGQIRSAVVGPGSATGDGPTGLQVDQLSSFGEDALCRVYVTSLVGRVYRLEAVSPAGAPACQADPTAPPAPALGIDPGTLDRRAPTLSGVTLSRRAFRVSSDPTPRIARTRTPVGTVFRYTLSEDADVSVRFYRATPGRRSGRSCLPPGRRLRRAAPCTRYPLLGTLLRRRVPAGRRLIRFTGRVGLHALPAGSYRAILRARDAAGNVSAGRVAFLRVLSR